MLWVWCSSNVLVWRMYWISWNMDILVELSLSICTICTKSIYPKNWLCWNQKYSARWVEKNLEILKNDDLILRTSLNTYFYMVKAFFISYFGNNKCFIVRMLKRYFAQSLRLKLFIYVRLFRINVADELKFCQVLVAYWIKYAD